MGRTVAQNLGEQLAMQEALSNPTIGKQIMTNLTDTRWLDWVKMEYVHRALVGAKVTIHWVAKYSANGLLEFVDDFKFK